VTVLDLIRPGVPLTPFFEGFWGESEDDPGGDLIEDGAVIEGRERRLFDFQILPGRRTEPRSSAAGLKRGIVSLIRPE
jgi:hypothetical protein